MRVAVCLSGQPRAIRSGGPSVRQYFSTDGIQFDFFCHTYDYMSWKIPHSMDRTEVTTVSPQDLNFIQEMFRPISFEVGNRPDPLPIKFPETSQSMFYSMARANQMRRVYEEEWGFEYKWVIKARYDLAFHTDARWRPKTEWKERQVCVSHMNRLPHEYRMVNFSDVLFYGDSWGMDIAADAYYEMQYPTRPSQQDFGTKRGPGTMFAEYLYRNNILCTWVPADERILRYESQNISALSWEEIDRIHWSYY